MRSMSAGSMPVGAWTSTRFSLVIFLSGFVRGIRQDGGVTAAALPASRPCVVVMARTRGKSKAANWRRPEQVAVIVLDLDLSGDPVLRRRVEKHWDGVFRV